MLLPNGWKIAPVGEQVPLDTLPMSSAISPNGRFMLVLNGGYKPPTISVIDADVEEGIVAREGGGRMAGADVFAGWEIRVRRRRIAAIGCLSFRFLPTAS